jgi:hypothetical protein
VEKAEGVVRIVHRSGVELEGRAVAHLSGRTRSQPGPEVAAHIEVTGARAAAAAGFFFSLDLGQSPIEAAALAEPLSDRFILRGYEGLLPAALS